MSGPTLYAQAATAYHFFCARARMTRLSSRAAIEAFQAHRLRRFLNRVAPRVEAFRQLCGADLGDFPVMDKATLMGAFHRYNRHGVTADEAWRAFEAKSLVRGCAVGASTGTSGNRGLYLVSDAERYLWLGTLLARALPEMLGVTHRVAVLLPRSSRLYDAANESSRLAMRFFDLGLGVEVHFASLEAFAPTAIVAPPKVLRMLAEADITLEPQQVFSGAEVLDPVDRAVIERRFATIVREIYMATEGLFAVACSEGTLHLVEDAVKFEWLPGPGNGNLVTPLITDFARSTQVMVRYQMNDLVRLADAPCACGSAFQAVADVVGRMDDVFEFYLGRKRVFVTPDVMRDAVVSADRAIDDFRIRQTGPNSIDLVLSPIHAEHLDKARRALAQRLERLGVQPTINTEAAQLAVEGRRKLRRVERVWRP